MRQLWKTGFYALVLVCGLFTAYTDTHTDEDGIIVFSVLICGFVLGFLQPQKAWRWALIIGLPIPIVEIFHLVAIHTNLSINNTSGPFMALIFALAGTYAGVLVARSLLRQSNQ